jgi:hypothetical protein
VLPSLPEGVLYFAKAGWHNNDGIEVTGVKFATYRPRDGTWNELAVTDRDARQGLTTDGVRAAGARLGGRQ